MSAQLPPCVAMFMPPPDLSKKIESTSVQPHASAPVKRPAETQPNPLETKRAKHDSADAKNAPTTPICFYKSRVLEVVRAEGCTMSHNVESGTLVGLHNVLRAHIDQLGRQK